MKTVRLGDVVDFYSGGTPSKSRLEWWIGEAPWFSAKDVKSPTLTDSIDHIADDVFERTSLRRLPAGTVVLAVRGMILAHTVPISVLGVDGAINQDLKALIPRHDIDSSYLAHMLRAQHALILSKVSTAAHGTKKLDSRILKNLTLPLPSLEEQGRIAAILDQADAIRTKRRQILTHLDAFHRACLDEHLARAVEHVRLGDVSDIQSGLTKGRRTAAATSPSPYLAVSNVQAGHLSLRSVRTIEATDAERIKYALGPGDVLLTEGGDPDKLGRGAIWRGEVPGCLHQNHVFRVRLPSDGPLSPALLSAHLGSRTAKSYFLRSAKQTTGIASINKKQLSDLPVPRLSPTHRARLEAHSASLAQITAQIGAALSMDDELLASLQSRAFRGEL